MLQSPGDYILIDISSQINLQTEVNKFLAHATIYHMTRVYVNVHGK